MRTICATTRAALLAATLAAALAACSHEWPEYRHNLFRSGDQINASPLSDPSAVPSLAVRWTWHVPSNAQPFYASPIVYQHRVYIGNGNGRFYALDATTGALLWQYPAATSPALTSAFTCNPSSNGIASSAVIAKVNGTDAVIFGAPDRSIGAGLGSGRLFALDAATGAVLWRSPEIAVVSGTAPSDRHEQIGYSSPLVFDGKAYIGIADHCDNPIQRGRVVAVDLASGAIVPGFAFAATPAHGGGVWNSVASDLNAIYFTTGNTANGNASEPSPNHGLSMLRLDRATGNIIWKFQPVPYALDADPDWAAGATVMTTSCGTLIASVQKDGWAYAVSAGSAAPGPPPVRWQFPATGYPFTPGDGTTHGDTDYKRPGAAWGDVLIITTGGESLTRAGGVSDGYGRLHALNACASPSERVRWILDVPTATTGPGGGYSLGSPSVTGGIVYVGTGGGHVVAIADPSVAPLAGVRCSNVQYSAAQCHAAGYQLVPIPAVLANVAVDGPMWNEPALADGKVYVATRAGSVSMLSP
jgi:outer membrane protein assembly factor BamB